MDLLLFMKHDNLFQLNIESCLWLSGLNYLFFKVMLTRLEGLLPKMRMRMIMDLKVVKASPCFSVSSRKASWLIEGSRGLQMKIQLASTLSS